MSGLMRRGWFIPAFYSIRMKNTVANGSQDLVAKQMARDGEDPLETGMTEESLRRARCASSVLNRRNPKSGRLHPLVRVVQEGRTAPPVDPHMILQDFPLFIQGR